ncbi:hypothetical protein GGR43_004582 [Sphingobium jiangsuense]|uniref:Uncharacterized protein n=1 Tax=Sphingobium jiangsuense TaxID=870476 RepID=A0A7W6BS77_9SPHN|nr:hypothetical protein [Sphingobium jiangsuense]MBB3928837.1 hypothetical protein [Sphingobium jiangsuense]
MDWRLRHQRKPCPPGFAEVFIVGGWRGVETVFGSRTSCNKRWVEECGGSDLKAQRQAYLAGRRLYREMIRRKPRKPQARAPHIGPPVRAAIEFLRSPEGGSWAISPTGQGDFYFGGTRQTGDQLVERARRKGLQADTV